MATKDKAKTKPKSRDLVASPSRPTNPPDHLADAKHVSGSIVRLVFKDDFVAKVTLAQLGLSPDEVDAKTAKATDAGLVFRQTRGRQKHVVDSATLRYVADPEYAAKIDKSIRDLHISPSEFDAAAAFPLDPRWHEVGDEEDLL